MDSEWWEDWGNVVLVCRYLVREEGFEADELLGVIEKPWNWQSSFEAAMEFVSASQRT